MAVIGDTVQMIALDVSTTVLNTRKTRRHKLLGTFVWLHCEYADMQTNSDIAPYRIPNAELSRIVNVSVSIKERIVKDIGG